MGSEHAGDSTMNIDVGNNGSDYQLIREGSAEIKVPRGSKVFYNPVQEFNRDLSVSVLQVASEDFSNSAKDQTCNFRILEALSATGLRSIRYAKEVPHVKEVVANDISQFAIDIIERNIDHNDVRTVVKSSHSDAVDVMFNSRHPNKRFHVVDLDPYGCPSQFLDSAVQCVVDGGVLLVTCTDMAVLCGNSPETCFVKYGAVSLKCKSCHEVALRIALQCIQSHAARYKRYIVPLLSVSVDFYIRVIVRIFTSAVKCKEITWNVLVITTNQFECFCLMTISVALIFSSLPEVCTGCTATHLQPLGMLKKKGDSEKSQVSYGLPHVPVIDQTCAHCSGRHHMGGPIWSAPLHDTDFVRKVISKVEKSNFKTKSRLMGILTMVLEELPDVPLYYVLPKLCASLKCYTMPMLLFRSAILNGGYRISYFHGSKESFKTDAPMSFVWDVIRQWSTENVPETKKKRECDATCNNLSNKSVENKIDFSLRSDANPDSRKNKLLRFQMNPAPFWGPGTRSSSNTDKPSKKVRNQNKKKRKASELAEGGEREKKIPSGDVVGEKT